MVQAKAPAVAEKRAARDVPERIGKYDVRVAFATPAENEDYRQRRVEALTTWLLARWESQRMEEDHGDARAAG